MKKLLSVLLALLMALTAVPMAFAEADAEENYLQVDCDSYLMKSNYFDGWTRTELAQGDVIVVFYKDTVGADVYVDGELVYTLETDDVYGYQVDETGTVDLEVRRGGEILFQRTYTVITRREMYPKVVRQMFREMFSLRVNPFLSKEELQEAADGGYPVGNPFLGFAYAAMILTNLMLAVFSFTRI